MSTPGEILRARREALGQSLADVAAETKIQASVLQKLEAGHDDFAAPVYVTGYLRAYANAVGAEPGEIIELYRAARTGKEIARVAAVEPWAAPAVTAPEEGASRRIGVALAVVFLLLVATLTLSVFMRDGANGDAVSRAASRSLRA